MQQVRTRMLVAVVLACTAGVALAIDPAQTARPPAAAPTPAPTPTTTPAPSPAPAPAAEAQRTPAPAQPPDSAEDEAAMKAPPPKATGATPQKFNPTEKVRADYPVAFPIDI